MEKEQLNKKVKSATKWSLVTQIIAKLVTPLTNIILARILAPEAFGVVAVVTMIISFVDMFTDAGFQKYLVQYEFKNKSDKLKSTNVAFITNLILSIFLWFIIIIFNEEIATLVGNPDLGTVIAISCIQLPITAFSSIQMALYRRDFDFKTLFIVRMFTISIPLLITVPLAFLGLSYWAIIIGNISMQLFNAIYLTFKSQWKPNLYFNFDRLKNMFSFSMWSLIEAVSIWLTTWIDAFIISSYLTEYYLGIYRTSTMMVNSLMAVVTASVMPVLFSTLSRLQNDNIRFEKAYLKTQRLAAVFLLPLGIGVYFYSDIATLVLLGDQWGEAAPIIGVWALTSSLMIVFGHFASEVYRAKGKPKLSFIAQMLHLIFLVPVCLISVEIGFWFLVYARAWSRMQFVLVHAFILQRVLRFKFINSIKNTLPMLFASSIMGAFAYMISILEINLYLRLMSIILCMVIYFSIVLSFKSLRREIKSIKN